MAPQAGATDTAIALDELRALGSILEAVADDLRRSRVRGDEGRHEAEAAIERVRTETAEVVQQLRDDVAAAVAKVESDVAEQLALLPELLARVGALEQATAPAG